MAVPTSLRTAVPPVSSAIRWKGRCKKYVRAFCVEPVGIEPPPRMRP